MVFGPVTFTHTVPYDATISDTREGAEQRSGTDVAPGTDPAV